MPKCKICKHGTENYFICDLCDLKVAGILSFIATITIFTLMYFASGG